MRYTSKNQREILEDILKRTLLTRNGLRDVICPLKINKCDLLALLVSCDIV